MLISLLIVLVVVGVLVYLLNVLVPMDARFKIAINCLIGLVLFLWVVNALTGGKYAANLLR